MSSSKFKKEMYAQKLKKKRIIAICGAVIVNIIMARKARQRRNRKIWTREWILERPRQGAYQNLINELGPFDKVSCTHFLQMDPSTFEDLLKLVAPLIMKKDTMI